MSVSWDDLAMGLPTHDDELQASHQGRPAVLEQDRTHGAGLPAEDLGVPDAGKYGC